MCAYGIGNWEGLKALRDAIDEALYYLDASRNLRGAAFLWQVIEAPAARKDVE